MAVAENSAAYILSDCTGYGIIQQCRSAALTAPGLVTRSTIPMRQSDDNTAPFALPIIPSRNLPSPCCFGRVPLHTPRYVYLFRLDPASNEFKIGLAGHPRRRRSELRNRRKTKTGEMVGISSPLTCGSAGRLEKELHKVFDYCHIYGDWFLFSESDAYHCLGLLGGGLG